MAETADSHKLIVSLEARMRSYEKAIERAQKQTNDRMRGVENALKRPQREMDKTGQAAERMEKRLAKAGGILRSFGSGFMGGIAAGGAVGIAAALANVANGIARIGDEANRAGVSARAFQEWKYVAEQARIPVDAMVDALKELSIRGDEFAATGKGGAADAFARLGMSPEEVQSKLRDPSALMLELIERTRALGNTAAGVRIFDELFGGTGGERLVSLLQQGEGAIRDQIRAAHDLGIVIDDDVIRRADELDRKFRQLTTTVGAGLKQAIVGAAGALQEFIDRFRQVEARQTSTLQAQLTEAQRNLTAAQEGRDRTPFGDRIFGRQIETSQAEVERLRQVLRDRALDGIRPQLESLSNPSTAPKGDRLGYVPPSTDGAGGGRGGGADAAEREAEAVRRLISELQEELALVGASNVEKEIANTLRRAGVDASSAEGQRIAELVRQIDAETAALDANKQAQEARTQALGSLFDMGSDALMSLIDNSLSAEDALKRLVTQLALAAAQAALLGTGPLAGLFGGGGIFGGAGGGGNAAVSGGKLLMDVFDYHSGGKAGSGTRGRSVSPAAFIGAPRFHNGTLGLRSNELAAVLERGEHVLTARQSANAAGVVSGLASRVSSGSGGGGSVVELRMSRDVEARIVERANSNAVRITQQGISEYDAVMPSRVNAISRDPWAR